MPAALRHLRPLVVRIFCVAAAAVAMAPSPASAAKRLALVPSPASNPAEGPVRAKVAKALKQHKIQLLPPAPVKKAWKKAGAPSSDEDWVNLARKLKVDGFVEPTFSQSGAKRRVEIAVRNGSDGGVVGQQTFSANGPPKRLAAAVGGSLWKKLGPAIKKTAAPKKEDNAGGGLAARDLSPNDEFGLAGGKPGADQRDSGATGAATSTAPAAAEKAPSASDSGALAAKDGATAAGNKGVQQGDDDPPKEGREPDTAEKQSAATPGTPRWLEVALELRLLRRRFQYVPASAGRYYFLDFVPLVGARAAWFPLPYLGIFAQGEYTAALRTGVYPTATREIVVGAQGRMSFGQLQVGASAAFFQHLFLIVDTANSNDAARSTLPTPDTTYTGARFAAQARYRLFDRVLVGVEGAYRLVTNPGQGTNQVRSPQYFPNGVVTVGVDASAFVGVTVWRFVELRAGIDYRRYVLGGLQGSVINASGGATDDYQAFSIGAVGAFGGK